MRQSYSDLTEYEKEIICDGCGPRIISWLIPDFIFSASCNQHDFYYKRGGDIFDKLEADFMFYAHMLKDINTHYPRWWQKIVSFLMATTYFLIVLIGGLILFRYGKYRTIHEIIVEEQLLESEGV